MFAMDSDGKHPPFVKFDLPKITDHGRPWIDLSLSFYDLDGAGVNLSQRKVQCKKIAEALTFFRERLALSLSPGVPVARRAVKGIKKEVGR